MDELPELLKPFANRFAEIASTKDGLEAIRLLQFTSLCGQASVSPPQPQATDAADEGPISKAVSSHQVTSNRVGIWERKAGTSYFVRRTDMVREWRLWANTGRIAPKGAKRRVVLIGESVARGYFHEPQFTAAAALESTLQWWLDKDRVEVIDLARTSLEMEIRELAISALLLDPDAAIIFAGNNWHPDYSKADIPAMTSALLSDGIAGLKRFCETSLAQKIRSLVEEVTSAYQARKVPLVWMIPEFNLGDWRDPLTNAPHLEEGSNCEWLCHWRTAQTTLQEGNFRIAAESAKKMVEADQKICVTGLYILAECSRLQGNVDEARSHLECARDAIIWDPFKHTPRPYSVTQNILREVADKHEHQVVDLPGLFKEYLKGELPDRRLFLDYCHLTGEGLRIAMASAASFVLQAFEGTKVPWLELARHSTAPSSRVRAEAAFLAAVHSAHWYQSYELVHHHCLEAIRLAPTIAEVMTLFLDLQTRRIPTLMSKVAEEIANLDWPTIQHYLLHFDFFKALDTTLLDSMVDSLKTSGIDAAERLAQLRNAEHSVIAGKTNLLEHYYCSAAGQPREAMWVTPGSSLRGITSHYYQAKSLESKFLFIGGINCPVRLTLTCRLPSPALAEPTVILRLNGERQAEIGVSHEWSTWDINVPAEAVQEGVNDVVICWPVPAFPGDLGIERAVADMLEETTPAFYPIFGEIYSFTISNARYPQAVVTATNESVHAVCLSG